VRTLQYLNSRDPEGHSHTVRMLLSFVHRQHLCIVFEARDKRKSLLLPDFSLSSQLLGMNLYDILRRTSFVGLSLGLVRRFAHQIVHALYFLSQVGIIHCDLKPENVLLRENKKSVIKGSQEKRCVCLLFLILSFQVIDFGSSCLQTEKMFKYIQSRFYRAPEVILELDYGCASDMWCVEED
jgi:serine/threonine protein kinase